MLENTRKLALVSYANIHYTISRRKLVESAKKVGGFTKFYSFAPWDIDKNFRRKYHHILKYTRGDGYWLWKPYFIKKALRLIDDDEYLMYVDSGAYFIDSPYPLVETLAKLDQPLLCFDLIPTAESLTKRDCFIAMGCDTPDYVKKRQILATYSLWKKCDASFNFLNEWLYYCCQEQLITDSKSKAANYPGFVKHLHDQSIFSLLIHKHGYESFRDLAVSKSDPRYLFCKNSDYEKLLNLHRKRTSSYLPKNKLMQIIAILCRPYLYRQGYIFIRDCLITKCPKDNLSS